MSAYPKKKPKKLRRPNVPGMTAGRAGGTPAAGGDGSRLSFDYSYVKKDLRRIGVLAGSLIAALVVLSFFIR